MRFSFSSNAFRKYTLEETIEILADAGYSGIELMADVPHAYPPKFGAERRRWLKKILTQNNLEIANINAFMLCALGDFHHPSWIETEEELRKQRICYTEECIRLASDLGVPTISTEPGGPVPNEMSEDLAWYHFLQGLERLYPVARDAQVRILVEPEPGLLIENLEQTLYLMENVDHEVVGINFDVGHFFCVGEDPWFTFMELKDFIGHVHLEDIPPSRVHQHTMLGEGAIDIEGFILNVAKSNYDGFITVELYPYEDEAPVIARKAMQYLRLITCP